MKFICYKYVLNVIFRVAYSGSFRYVELTVKAVDNMLWMQSQGVRSQTVNKVWNRVKARTADTPASDHENRYSAALNLDKSWLNTPIHTNNFTPAVEQCYILKAVTSAPADTHTYSEQTWDTQVSVHWSWTI